MMNEQEIKDRIANLQDEIETLKSLSIKLKESSRSRKDEIFKKYVEVESIPKVLAYLRENKYTKENGLKYTANDISELIQSKSSSVDQLIVKFAQNIFISNRKRVAKRYW